MVNIFDKIILYYTFLNLKYPYCYFSYDKTCPRGDKADCFFEQSSKYWFFLAFEANNCPGYISEYFWKSLTKPIIPVVMGGPGYKDQAPNNSYIDVNDYKSVEELANYMKYLVSNTVSSNQCLQLSHTYKITKTLQYIFRLHTNNTLNGNHNINSTSQIHSVIYAQSYMIHLYLPKRILMYQNGFMKIRLRMEYHIAKMALKEHITKVCSKKNK